MRKIYYILIFILISLHGKAQQDTARVVKLTKIKQLSSLSRQTSNIINECKKIAENALQEAPQPIETISTEGRLQGDPIKITTQLSIKDFNKIYALAIAYKMTDQKKYLDKAVIYLKAWAKLNKPAGNPINDTNLDAAIEGYNLIKSVISKEDDAIITNWLKTISSEEFKSFLLSQHKETSRNNWHSHRLKIMAEINYTALNDPANQQLIDQLVKNQIAVNLSPDGSSIDFKRRDALHYHVYDLEPLLKLAIVIKEATGFDFYTYQSTNGASIKKSVEWLLPYLTGEKTHGEYVNSTVKFDQDRAINGEPGFKKGTLFEPVAGLKTLALAGYFDSAYDELYQKIKGDAPNNADWQLLYRLLILQ